MVSYRLTVYEHIRSTRPPIRYLVTSTNITWCSGMRPASRIWGLIWKSEQEMWDAPVSAQMSADVPRGRSVPTEGVDYYHDSSATYWLTHLRMSAAWGCLSAVSIVFGRCFTWIGISHSSRVGLSVSVHLLSRWVGLLLYSFIFRYQEHFNGQ